jgi:hypothetical protein
MGALVGSSPGAAEPSEVRVALAATGTRTSRWVSLRVHGTGETFAWIVPVKPDALVDLASDAWLESLEDATAPRVVPPNAVPPCGFAGGVEVEGDVSHVVTTSPDAVAVAPDGPSLVTTLAAWGLAMPSDLAPLVDDAAANGDGFVALRYPAAPGTDLVTRTLRVVDASPPDVALSMMRAASPVAVTAYSFTTGLASVGTQAVAIDPSLLLWNATGSSTYTGVRDTLLSSNPGAWLLETSAHAPLFAGESLPNDPGAIDALSSAYFTRATAYGDTSASAGTCTESAATWASSISLVGYACPAGKLANVGSASCQEATTAEQIAPDAFRCGGIADDLALALSGLAPGSTWVSRGRTVLAPGAFGKDDRVTPSPAAGVSTGPVVTCAGYDQLCGGAGSSGAPPTGSSSSSSGSSSGTASSGGGSDNGSDPGAGAAAAADVASAALDSTSGCFGDSSSSDGGGDTCGGGSTESTGDSGGGCSGSTDSSSSCAVADASTRPRGGRSPVSRVVLLLAAFAAIARRGKRTTRQGNGPPI